MEFAIDIAGKAFEKILCYAWNELKKCIRLKGEIQDMKGASEHLESQLTDIRDELNTQDKKPFEAVEKWLDDMEETRKGVEELAEEFRIKFECKQQNGCDRGCRKFWHGEKINRQVGDNKLKMKQANGYVGVFPYVWHRFKISHQVDACKSHMGKLKEEYEGFHRSYGILPCSPYLHPGGYGEESFEEEISQIKLWLKNEDVQVIGVRGIQGECTSLLKFVHNNDEVKKQFHDMTFFIQKPSSSPNDIATARDNIGELIGLTAPVSVDKLFHRLRRKRFDFLLVLDDLHDRFNIDELKKMVREIGLPPLEGKHPHIVFSCRSEKVVDAMQAKKTCIEVSPRETSSWNAYQASKESLPRIDEWPVSYKPNQSSGVNLSAINSTEMISLHCFALTVQFYFGYDTVMLFFLISWVFVMMCIYLLWLWTTGRWKLTIFPAKLYHQSTQKLKRSYTEELETLSTWLSWDLIPQKGDNDYTTCFEAQRKSNGVPEPEIRSSSSFERKSDAVPEQEIGSSSRLQRKSDVVPEPEICSSSSFQRNVVPEPEIGSSSNFQRKSDKVPKPEIVPAED